MPWKCVLIEPPDLADPDAWGKLPVGSMWHLSADEAEKRKTEGTLSDRYLRETSKVRMPIVVKLPGRSIGGRSWCVDEKAYNSARGGWYGAGWIVTGAAPLITCSPSINMPGDYHGHVQSGIVTESSDPATRADLFPANRV
jgi:hypothetical protein